MAVPASSRPAFLAAFLALGIAIIVLLFYVSEDIRGSLLAIGAAIQQGMGLQQPVNSASAGSGDASNHAALTQDIEQFTKWASSSTTSVEQRSRKAITQPTITSAPAIIPSKQASGSAPSLITTIIHEGKPFEIISEPIPDDCSPEMHADYEGYAVQWGLSNKKHSAAECCRACKEFKPKDGLDGCNIWVWCGDPSGVCWTMDIHNHTTGDCWLKHQSGWDGITDRKTTNLKINHRGKFTPEFRKEHKTSPEMVPWIAGLVKPPSAAN